MSNSNLTRWSGLSMLLAGITNAGFWLMVIPIGTFAGTAASLHPLWNTSQLLHSAAALLALFGLVGLYALRGGNNGGLGLVGLILSLFGTAFYLADGLFALVIFPMAATNAPALIAADGPLNTSPVYIVFAATFMIGYIIFSIALWREGTFPRPAIVLLIIGSILANLPPILPMIILIIGGVLWSIGAVWLGGILWSGKNNVTA